MNMRQFDISIGGLGGVFKTDLNKVGGWSNSDVHAAGGSEFGLGAFVGSEGLEYGDEVVVGEVGVIAAEEAIDVAAGKASTFGEVFLLKIPPFCFALKCYSKITHELVYADGSWFATFSRKTGRKFFCSCGFKIWNCYRIATTDSHRCRRMKMNFYKSKQRERGLSRKKSSTFFSNFYFHPQQQQNRNDTKTREGIFERSKLTKKPGV